MAGGQPVGTMFAEMDLDLTKLEKGLKSAYERTVAGTEKFEQQFKALGIKSDRMFESQKQMAIASYNAIAKSSKSTANDIIRAEQAKNDQLKRLNDQQFGHQTSLIESIKKNWLAYSAGVVAAYYAINKAVDFIGTLTAAASDLQETQSKSNAVFGASAQAITSWSKNSATAFGMSRQAALESASSIGNMFKQLGAGETTAAKTSKQMVELSADLASFHNVAGGATEVLNAMQSAFRGQYEPIQRYIPTINAAAVEQQALAMTGKQATSELTRLEKAAAAQAIIMRDAGDAVGDFAKTSGGLANQQRILEANFKDLKAAIGEGLLPVAAKVVTEMNNWVGANKDLIGQKVGETIDTITASVIAVADAYNKASDALRIMRMLMNIPLPGDYAKMFPGQQAPITTGKIGPQTPGFNLYSSKLKSEWVGSSPAPEVPISADLQKLIDAEYGRLKKESEEYYSWIAKQDADSLIKYEKNRETETSLMTKELDKIESENKEYYTWLSMENEKSLKESTELASEKAQAYGKMYKDMKGDAATYYKYQIDALDKQRDNYEKLVGKNAVTDSWYARKKKKLDRELTLSSNDFFGGIRVGYERSRESAVTFAQVGESTFRSFTDASSNMATDNFFNLFTGRMDELQLDWISMWDAMARTAADKLADIAIQKGLDLAISGIDWLGSAMGYWAAGSWDIKRDQLAILHKGEMVVPKEDAERMRAGNDTTLGAAWGGFAGHTAASVAAAASLASSGIGLAIGKVAGWAFTGALNPAIPLGWAAVELGRAVYAGFAAEAAFAATGAMPGDVESEHAGNLGAGAFGDIAEGFGAADFGGDIGGGGGMGGGMGDVGGIGGASPSGEGVGGGMGDPGESGDWHKGGRLKLRNDEGFFVGQKGEEVVTEKNLKILQQLVAATATGRTGGGITHVHLNLDGREVGYAIIKDGAVIEQIDYKINKLSKRVYQ